MAPVSLNDLAGLSADRMIEDAALLRIAAATGSLGETLVDCGAEAAGGIEAGLRLAHVCMGGLGRITLGLAEFGARWPWLVTVRCADPVTACLASQYAGWSLNEEKRAGGFFALGSGPARALARVEPLFAELAHRERSERAVLVLEADRAPPAAIVEKVARDCGVAPARLTILFAPTRSLAGAVQVVARVVEVALHKAHALHFPLERILDAVGGAPLSPPHPDFVQAIGRTNDAIIYGGRVQLFVAGPEAEARALAEQLPSRNSRDYGAPFAAIFKRFGGDFYAIDPMLFSPAQVTVTAVETGASFHAGAVAPDLLDASFGG